jgi:dihydrofolate reductase
MRQLVVLNHLTLDGVTQAPGRSNEDPRGGFEHGGWAAQNVDEVMGRDPRRADGRGRRPPARAVHVRADVRLLAEAGRRQPLESSRKYVASRTLQEPLPWANSTLLGGDAADAVTALKADGDGSLTVMGSGDLLRCLMRRNLVDEYSSWSTRSCSARGAAFSPRVARSHPRARRLGRHDDRRRDRHIPRYEKRCGNWWMMPVLSMSAMPRISRSTRS